MALKLPLRPLIAYRMEIISHNRPSAPRLTPLAASSAPLVPRRYRQGTLCIHSLIPRRTLFGFGRKKKVPHLDPFSAEFLEKKPAIAPPTQPVPSSGGLAPSSIFGQEAPADTGAERRGGVPQPKIDPVHRAAVLDPYPLVRRRWERKQVIRQIRRRGRINKSTLLARTEREHLCKSPFWHTSVKKLGPLARQIAGKPVEEAILQMRFSKKKVAQDVKRHLEYARDEAVVRKGMGLGGVVPEGEQAGEPREEMVAVGDYKRGRGKTAQRPRTAVSIDQAWVGRGPYGKEIDYRARGQAYMMRPPTTSEPLP
jgi:ribosomal protein L22